jgi:hypothetical protein
MASRFDFAVVLLCARGASAVVLPFALLCVLRFSSVFSVLNLLPVPPKIYRVGNSQRTPTRPTIGNPNCKTGVAAV